MLRDNVASWMGDARKIGDRKCTWQKTRFVSVSQLSPLPDNITSRERRGDLQVRAVAPHCVSRQDLVFLVADGDFFFRLSGSSSPLAKKGEVQASCVGT